MRPAERSSAIRQTGGLRYGAHRFVMLLLVATALFALASIEVQAQSKMRGTATNSAPPPLILTVEGTNVFVQRARAAAWESAYPNLILAAKDRGRTGARSRTSVRLSDLSVLRIGQFSEFEIQPLPDPQVEAEFSLFRGLLYLLNRDRPGRHRFVTPTATAATRGTEFTLEVDEGTGRTLLTVLEGEAELSNAVGSIRIRPGEQGLAVLGQMPTKTAVIDTANVVQWCLYYPGVLDVNELELTPDEQTAIASSLEAYRTGDLLRAVAAYPGDRLPGSDAERVYLTALLLAIGQVIQAEAQLSALSQADKTASRSHRLASALRLMIATVKRRAPEQPIELSAPALATELLARSYYEQSEKQLDNALRSARSAVAQSPQFAFGWTRVAELEFSHGRTKRALPALETSLSLAPRNAQALALKGFLLSAQNRMEEARGYFDRAIEIDGGLGNAWLGRGLSRIRQGHAKEGRFDLHVAATTEPQRSILRSYLGKAFSNAGEHRRAETELRLAQEIDSGDPTPWLYSALLLQQENRINESVEHLQHAQRLNENRAVYRSQLLLDQDRAVAGANLANAYRDVGMTDVSLREAGRAVNADYANYSAHLFLADSFNQLRDPKQINLRYETAWFTEYLVANLLAPVGAGTLSQAVSQQEYSKLFEGDRLRLTSSSEYRSNGDWLQSAVQHGTIGNSGYAAEVFYRSDNGQRPNNEFSELQTTFNFKQQLSASDSILLRASYYDNEAGDVNQYYDQRSANRNLRTAQEQPSLLAGYHHEWSPGIHTLFMVGALENRYDVDNPLQSTLFWYAPTGPLSSVTPLFYEQDYRSDLQLYTAELQQLWQRGDHTLVVGGRFQTGKFSTRNNQSNGEIFDGTNLIDIAFPIAQDFATEFDRETIYAYDHWQLWPSLMLVGGVTYDRLNLPENFRYAPLSPSQDAIDQLSPKAGLIFTPFYATTLRAAYYRSLGGIDLDQSVRLEPSQVAGFNQSYRSLIPESVSGANSGARFETWALSLEQKVGQKTFIGIQGEILSSEVERNFGAIQFFSPFLGPPFSARQTREELHFRERNLHLTLNQLLSSEWALGGQYRISHAELDSSFPQIPNGTATAGGFFRERSLSATLQQLHLSLLYNHPSGFFSGAGAIWTQQSNFDYSPDLPGDDFWQFNLEVGWRFFRRRLETRVALLNIADQDYRLNPLNLTQELPRERTLAVSLRFNF